MEKKRFDSIIICHEFLGKKIIIAHFSSNILLMVLVSYCYTCMTVS